MRGWKGSLCPAGFVHGWPSTGSSGAGAAALPWEGTARLGSHGPRSGKRLEQEPPPLSPSREKAGAGARPLPMFPSREKTGAGAARSLPLSPRHCQCSRSGRTREYPETQTRTGKREHGREGNKGFLKEVLLNHIVERSQGAGCNLSPKREGKCEMVSACVPKETF